MNEILERIERVVERITGRDIDYLRRTSLDEQRRDVERRTGKPIKVEGSYKIYGPVGKH